MFGPPGLSVGVVRGHVNVVTSSGDPQSSIKFYAYSRHKKIEKKSHANASSIEMMFSEFCPYLSLRCGVTLRNSGTTFIPNIL